MARSTWWAGVLVASSLACSGGSGGGGGDGGGWNTCAEGMSCTPVDRCHEGTTSCATGTAVCVDTGLVAADGASCGSGLVCRAGACVDACVAGRACQAASACKAAVTSCASTTAESVCVESGNLPNGTACGSDDVCQDGACVAASCAPDQPCQPANPCTTGVTSCATPLSAPSCVATATKADGTSCGTGTVCSGGSCVAVACVPNAPCDPANPCLNGAIACTSPATPGTCAPTASKPDGVACGAGLVCAAGTCVTACVANQACQPTETCKIGTTSCGSAASAPTCIAIGNRLDGTACGTELVCSNGACVALCKAGVPCTPSTACRKGVTSCTSAWTSATCADSGDQPDGTACGEGRVCAHGSCVGATLVVTLASPSGTTYTGGVVQVAVEVQGGQPDRVELLVDGAVQLQLAPPYHVAWDTTPTAEGVHQLVARAALAGSTWSSEARTVVVDRSPPQVLSRVPAPGATNVWSRDPVTVTFSEPLLPGSVTDGSVLLAGEGSVELAKRLELSSDGRTLRITPLSPPSVPNTLTVALSSALTDRAGNGLVVPGDSWSWQLPALLDSGVLVEGTRHRYFEVALGRGGAAKPTLGLAYAPERGYVTGAYTAVLQLDGDASDRSANVTIDPDYVFGTVSVDVSPSGVASLAWLQYSAASRAEGHLVLGDWNGSSWVTELGLEIDPTAGPLNPTLRYDASGRLLLAWTEAKAIIVKRRDGAWQRLGEAPLNDTSLSPGDLNVALDAEGRPVVTWLEGDSVGGHAKASTWRGSYWVPVEHAGSGARFTDAKLRAGRDGLLVQAWREGTPSKLVVGRWPAIGSTLTVLGTPRGGANAVYSFALAVDADGQPLIAWGEVIAYRPMQQALHVERWNGMDWEQLGQSGVCAWVYDVVATASGSIAVACETRVEDDPYAQPVRLLQYNR